MSPNETNFWLAALAATVYSAKLVMGDKVIALVTMEDKSMSSARFVMK
ncbi:hypothetical protein [Paraburkholderia piptadeniae]|nr:hypothetical protein [Paraburkholderia piptadeniae]